MKTIIRLKREGKILYKDVTKFIALSILIDTYPL